ncbi:MAG: hypothetical protein ACLSWM_01235 [Barnesiella sp.]|nr:hypothetical protein [Barnesiella sp. GGCC_0306]MBS7039523.1 hypothetical protein [Bacteroidales bacterium]
MKKNILLSILLCFLGSQTIQANQPERRVFYTLGKNEVLHHSEFTASLKYNGQKFACIIADTVRKELSFIYDGEKKITVDYYIWCYYINFDRFDKCIIGYGNHQNGLKSGEGQYYMVEDKLYGPYEACYNILSPSSYFHPDWNEIHHFNFKRMGSLFTHKSDGTIKVKKAASSNYYAEETVLPEDILEKKEEIFLSPNEKHVARFSVSDVRNVYVDKELYIIPGTPQNKYYACSVFDDGSCLYYNRANLYNTGTGTVMVGGDRDAFYLANGNIRKLSLTEAFNFKTQSIVLVTDMKENACGFVDFGYYDYVKGGDYIIPDKEEKHYFISNAQYQFVMIDEHRYGRECALQAWYDLDENAFLWIAWEGNELVSYRYKL